MRSQILLTAVDVREEHREALSRRRMREESVAKHGEGQVTEHRGLHRRHQLTRVGAEC